MSIFVDETTTVVIQGISPTSQGLYHGLRNRAYGTKVVAGTNPRRGGEEIEGIPVYATVAEAVAATGATASFISVPPPHAAAAILEAAEAGIAFIVCITEGIPAQDEAVTYNRLVEEHPGTRLLGPNCPGVISPGKCNIGITSGDIALPGGPVGIVSRSGTLTYQALHELSQQGVGQTTCVGIGGDPVPGTNFIDCLSAFQADPDTTAIMMIGEIGGSEEERAADYIAEHVTKPVVCYIAGVTAPPGRKMGHAGAIISGSQGTAQAKMEALAAAGATVAQNPTEAGVKMVEIVKELGLTPPGRVGVLASGTGTILEAVLAAGVPVTVVVSDRPCRALDVAAGAGVEAVLVDRRQWGGFAAAAFDRRGYTEAVTTVLVDHALDLVAMAGFGTVLDEPVHAAFPGRILNTHPSLLPAFPGWHAVADALAAGVAVTGCTVHVATLELDAGPVLAQAEVAVAPGDTVETLHERIKAAERRLYPATILDVLALDAVAGMRALVSVYDKTGVVDLARGLVDLGWEVVASGNTARALADAGVAHREVAEVTGSPEMLGGRVKTLHPRIHGAILADRSVPSHLDDLAAQGIEPIDLVVCNLYPFASDPSVELIDVGGPTMVRAAAKNHAHVGVVTAPSDYPAVLEELRSAGTLSAETRRRLARAAFAHTAAYDAAIVAWLDGDDPLPPTLHLTLERAAELRYGENPHQRGARYRSGPSWWDTVTQHGGTALSYLNIFDADAAWRLVHELAADSGGRAAVAIVKHANPCGAAVGDDLVTAFERALECDPVSAFGGIVALGGPVTEAVAEAVAAGPQADVIVAPSYEPAALARLAARRRATRLLSAPTPEPFDRQVRTLGAAVLVQDADRFAVPPAQWEVVTGRRPTDAQWADLALAWRVCGRTTSNAIAVVTAGQAVGVGAGQQSRVVAAELAVEKAGDRAKGGAAASDAFFPFPDALQVLARAGVAAVVQPGGSVRDAEVVAAAEEAGVVMVTTGERHFRH